LQAMTSSAVAGFRRLLPPRVRGLARRVRRRLLHSTDFVLITKDLAEPKAPSTLASLTVRAVGEADYSALDEFCRVHRAVEPEATARLRDCRSRGYRGFLATAEGALLGHLWWVDASGHGARPHPRVRALSLELGEHSAYLFDFFIAPARRGKGVSQAFLADVYAQLRKSGYTRVVGDVVSDDRRARWTYRADGWKDGRTVRIWSVLSSVLICPGGWRFADSRWF